MVETGKVALLLAGGGSLGLLSIGVLRAWRELNLKYDYLFGSSVGALIGLQFHAGDFLGMEEFWKNVKNEDVYKGSITQPFNSKSPSIYDSSPLRKTIQKNIDYASLISNPNNFYINCTDWYAQTPITLECKSLSEEDLISFIHASASPPLLFPPVSFKDRTLVDGGLTANYSISDALQHEVDTIVLVNPQPLGHTPPINGLIGMIGDAISCPMHNQLKEEIECIDKINSVIEDLSEEAKIKYKKINLINITVDTNFGISFLDFSFRKFR